MAKLNLSAPWEIYYKKLSTFFAEDPEVHVVYDDVEMEVKLYVENADKATALEKMLPKVQEFGNVKLYVTIVPANGLTTTTGYDVLKAFEVNGAVHETHVTDGFMQNKMYFIVFEKVVVQYFTDSIGDWHGLTSTLYQDLAKDIFGNIDGVYFCTDNGMGEELESVWF